MAEQENWMSEFQLTKKLPDNRNFPRRQIDDELNAYKDLGWKLVRCWVEGHEPTGIGELAALVAWTDASKAPVYPDPPEEKFEGLWSQTHESL